MNSYNYGFFVMTQLHSVNIDIYDNCGQLYEKI